MLARIIPDPASPTEEVSTRFFKMNLCKLPFLIMCLFASFTMNAVKVNSPAVSAQKRGAGSAELFFHLKENDTIRLALKRAVFDRLKKCVFLHYQ